MDLGGHRRQGSGEHQVLNRVEMRNIKVGSWSQANQLLAHAVKCGAGILLTVC